MTDPMGYVRGVVAALSLVAALVILPESARADDVEVTEVTTEQDDVFAHVSVVLQPIDAQIRAQADAELRRAVPALFGAVDVGVLRYVNARTEVSDVRFTASSDPREVVVAATVEVRADRERRDVVAHGLRLPEVVWRADGGVHVATVNCRFVVRVRVLGDGSVEARASLRRVEATVHLQLLRGATVAADVEREVAARTFDVPAVRRLGLRLVDGTVTGVRDQRLHLRLRLTDAR